MTNAGDAVPIARLPTGVVGLDHILHGGLLAGGIYAILGHSGAGKTVLGNQLCFRHVAAGGRALYVTLLTETHGHMFTNLQSLRFFTRAPIGETLHYFSVAQILAAEGFDGLLMMLRAGIRDTRATLLIIDGTQSMEATTLIDREEGAFSRFLTQLQTTSEASRCTAILLAHGDAGPPTQPQMAMVDGAIELLNEHTQLRAVRELQVRKFCGSAYMTGRHTFTITDDGVVVYPRTEALLRRPSSLPVARQERLSTGIVGLDTMLAGGIRAGATTLVLGPSGSAKTVFGLHFLQAGAAVGEPGLHFGFYETPPELVDKAGGIGLPLDHAVAAGTVEILWQPPVENLLDELAERLLAAVSRRSVRRLFIDGLNAFQMAARHPKRMGPFFAALTNELRARQVTTLISFELLDLISPTVSVQVQGISAGAENLLLVRQVEWQGAMTQMISIQKSRASDYDRAIRTFTVSNRGIVIGAPFSQAVASLTGVAQPNTPVTDQRRSRRRTRRRDDTAP